MKWAIWVFAAALLSGTAAMGDADDLSGGALIAHYASEVTYSSDPPACGNWCCAYTDFAITSIAQERVRIDGGGETPVIWYVLAAWQEDKTWCAVEFGFGNYTKANFEMVEYGPCFPVHGSGLELPTPGWPGPNEGTAITRTGTAWTGNWRAVYYFVGYAYDGVEMIPLSIDPPTEYCGFANCLNPPGLGPVPVNRRGAMGINMEGIKVGPSEEPSMVCCVPSGETLVCFLKIEQDCIDMGGTFRPDLGNDCTGNPCDPERACCWTNTLGQRVCSIRTQSSCAGLNESEWLATITTCTPDPCKDAACCVGTTCSITTQLECNTLGGVFVATVTSCDPNPCTNAACCVNEVCQVTSYTNCQTLGGHFVSGVATCEATPAPCDKGACCFDTEPYCQYIYHDECLAGHPEVGGVFTPGEIWHPNRDCGASDPCFPSPVEESTWGRIKRLYQ